MSKHVAVLAKKRSTRKVLVGATTIGIDLGDQWSHYCMLDEAGEVLEEGRFRTTEGGVGKRFEDMESARIAMEAGTHSCRGTLPFPPCDRNSLTLALADQLSFELSRRPHDTQQLIRHGRILAVKVNFSFTKALRVPKKSRWSGRSARDRDRLREMTLVNQGWKI
jgi:hypothetical protein